MRGLASLKMLFVWLSFTTLISFFVVVIKPLFWNKTLQLENYSNFEMVLFIFFFLFKRSVIYGIKISGKQYASTKSKCKIAKNCDCSCIIDYQKLISRQKLNWKRFIPQKEIMFKNSKNEVLVVKRIKILLKMKSNAVLPTFLDEKLSLNKNLLCKRQSLTLFVCYIH